MVSIRLTFIAIYIIPWKIKEISRNCRKSVDVFQVTPIVLEAVGHLKGKKSGPPHDSSSDCLKNAPMILFEQLATSFRISDTLTC